MGGGRPSRATIPTQDPIPFPVPLDVEALEKDRARRRQKLKQFGRGGTILTQGGLGASEQQRGTLLTELGGST